MENFSDQLADSVRRTGNAICVGLDPRWEQLPDSFRRGGASTLEIKARAYSQFCREVCDVVSPLVGVVKVQAAFFEELGPPGMTAMGEVIRYAQSGGLIVILDGKRSDIGSTAEAYARGYLGRAASAWHADAITVSPYLGDDSLAPFVNVAQERGAGVFVLVKTSNPGGRTLQDLECDGRTIYARVAEYVESLAKATAGECGYGCVGAVVGATFPAQLAELRRKMPHAWLLVPGYGSQGGTAADVAAAFDSNGLGAIVNNSRGIIFAHLSAEFAQQAGQRWQDAVAGATRQMIADLKTAVSSAKR